MYPVSHYFPYSIDLNRSINNNPNTAGGDNLRTTVTVDGVTKDVPDYASVQGILIGVVVAYVFILTLLGPEYVAVSFLSNRVSIVYPYSVSVC